jgi:hypothetical protein
MRRREFIVLLGGAEMAQISTPSEYGSLHLLNRQYHALFINVRTG